jgi:hypothetical protein
LARILASAHLLALLAVLAGLVAVPAADAAGIHPRLLAVPVPTVAGPLTGGLRGHPFMGLLHVPHGFVEEEYLVSGTARPFYGPSVLAQRPVAGTDRLPPLPYTTRIIVVRPSSAARSNGTAVVTWENVTFGHDIDEWFDIGRQVVADGYTYVDADVQLASEAALKAFDPVRYAAVNIPDDAYPYDIYSQVAQALRHRTSVRSTPRRHVLDFAASQSGYAIDQYLTAVQPFVQHVFDGFIDAVANGPDHHTDRPVIRMLSEDEIDGSSASPDARNYRQWEIAGSAHGNLADFRYVRPPAFRSISLESVTSSERAGVSF